MDTFVLVRREPHTVQEKAVEIVLLVVVDIVLVAADILLEELGIALLKELDIGRSVAVYTAQLEVDFDKD